MGYFILASSQWLEVAGVDREKERERDECLTVRCCGVAGEWVNGGMGKRFRNQVR